MFAIYTTIQIMHGDTGKFTFVKNEENDIHLHKVVNSSYFLFKIKKNLMKLVYLRKEEPINFLYDTNSYTLTEASKKHQNY